MKKVVSLMVLVCVLLAGCNAAGEPTASESPATKPAHTEDASTPGAEGMKVIQPLPDGTMEALSDSIVSVSFGEGDFYRTDSGETMLRVQVYAYDKYDLVDISMLQPGDILKTCDGEVVVESTQTNEFGAILINGGLDNGGLNLVTDDSGIYCVQGYSDLKSWYLAGEAELPVSDSFEFTDYADRDKGTVVLRAAAFLNKDPGIDYRYQPHDTVIRIENGQVVAMERSYTP